MGERFEMGLKFILLIAIKSCHRGEFKLNTISVNPDLFNFTDII